LIYDIIYVLVLLSFLVVPHRSLVYRWGTSHVRIILFIIYYKSIKNIFVFVIFICYTKDVYIFIKKGDILLDDLIAVITNVGFPIAITVYLLVRFDGMMNVLVKSQERMIETLDRLYNKLK